MKKILFLVAVLAVLAVFGCVSDAQPAEKEEPVVYETSGKDVLFVGRLDGGVKPHDKLLIDRLTAMGFTVTGKEAKILSGKEAQQYDFVFISETNDSKRVVAKFVDTDRPVLLCEPYVYDDMGFTGMNSEINFGKKEMMYSGVKIAKPEHPLAAGFSGTVEVFSKKGTMGFGKPEGEVTVVATAPNDDAVALIFAYEKGAKNKLGETQPGRRVQFFLMENMEDRINENGWNLFDAAVKYTFTK
ncbi:MAG: hypothetical protein JW904_08545 [Spirochaetales bacterium]|nr:hypothetical protein [Spirochaetales bacterium]